jgi:iron complex outermembrane receptor protein
MPVDDSALGLSAGAILELGGGRALALNLASAERVAVAEELFSNGPHLASDSFEVGDPGLATETSRHFDIGLRKTGGDIGWSVTAFVTDYDDFIYLRDTGLIEDQLPRFEFSQQDARFHGLEAEVLLPLAARGPGELDLRVFADYVRAELESGDNVPRIPPLRFGARLEYHTDRFVVGLSATEYDDQKDIAPFETPTAGYTLVGADFDMSVFERRGRILSVFARATNLLDENARRHTSLVKDIAPLPGRNLSLGIRLDY